MARDLRNEPDPEYHYHVPGDQRGLLPAGGSFEGRRSSQSPCTDRMAASAAETPSAIKVQTQKKAPLELATPPPVTPPGALK